MELTPRDYLHTILALLSSPMNGSCKYAGLLAEKANGILAHSGGPRASIGGYEEGLEELMAGDGGQRVWEVDGDDVGDCREASANDSVHTHETEGQNGNVSIARPNEPAIFDLGVLGDVNVAWLGRFGMDADVAISPPFSPGFWESGVDPNVDPVLVALDAGMPMAIQQMGGPMELEMGVEYGYQVD
jgi:hypothetical protein